MELIIINHDGNAEKNVALTLKYFSIDLICLICLLLNFERNPYTCFVGVAHIKFHPWKVPFFSE